MAKNKKFINPKKLKKAEKIKQQCHADYNPREKFLKENQSQMGIPKVKLFKISEIHPAEYNPRIGGADGVL